MCVCLSVPRLLPSNQAYTSISMLFVSFFLVFNSRICLRLFPRKSTFHGYFVVSNPHTRLCILLVVEQSRGARSFYIEHTLMQGDVILGWFIALGCLALLVDIDIPSKQVKVEL